MQRPSMYELLLPRFGIFSFRSKQEDSESFRSCVSVFGTPPKEVPLKEVVLFVGQRMVSRGTAGDPKPLLAAGVAGWRPPEAMGFFKSVNISAVI